MRKTDRDPSAEEREAVLDRTRATYRDYESSGYARRWRDRSLGSVIASEQLHEWILGELRIRQVRTLVDVGCGDGDLPIALDQLGFRPDEYLGFDLLPIRIDRAQRRVPWGRFAVASADRLPLPSSGTDAVAAVTLFSSLREQWLREAVAREIIRVLDRSGVALVYDLRIPNPMNPRIRPVTARDLRVLFPGCEILWRTMTLLPPIARSFLGAGRGRYRLLHRLPLLRSHICAVVNKV